MNDQQEYYKKNHKYLYYSDTPYVKYIASEMIHLCHLYQYHNILEIGCGAGRFTIPLSNQGIELTAVDASTEMLGKLKDSLLSCSKIDIIHSPIETLHEHTNRKFDIAIGFHILHHIDDISFALRAIKKILKPNSKVAFLEPNPWNPFYYASFILYKDHTWAGEKGIFNLTKGKLKRYFESSGFSIPSIDQFGLLPPFFYNKKIIRPFERIFNSVLFLRPIAAYMLIQASNVS